MVGYYAGKEQLHDVFTISLNSTLGELPKCVNQTKLSGFPIFFNAALHS